MDNIESKKVYLVARAGCFFYYIRDYWVDHESAYDTLLREIPWQHYSSTSRMSCFMGPEGTIYPDSGIDTHPWHSIVLEMKEKVERELGYEVDSCLLNYYPDGKTSLAKHKDKECAGKDNVTIGITLGATRDLVLRQENIKRDIINTSYQNDVVYERNSQGLITRIVYTVKPGDLYLMGGYFHAAWTHEVPKRMKVDKGRISLTFRKLY